MHKYHHPKLIQSKSNVQLTGHHVKRHQTDTYGSYLLCINWGIMTTCGHIQLIYFNNYIQHYIIFMVQYLQFPLPIFVVYWCLFNRVIITTFTRFHNFDQSMVFSNIYFTLVAQVIFQENMSYMYMQAHFHSLGRCPL